MEKQNILNLIDIIAKKENPALSHLEYMTADSGEVYRFYKYSDMDDEDDILGVIRNTENENHAVIFESGFILFSALIADFSDYSDLTHFKGETHDSLIEILNKKFSHYDDFDKHFEI